MTATLAFGVQLSYPCVSCSFPLPCLTCYGFRHNFRVELAAHQVAGHRSGSAGQRLAARSRRGRQPVTSTARRLALALPPLSVAHQATTAATSMMGLTVDIKIDNLRLEAAVAFHTPPVSGPPRWWPRGRWIRGVPVNARSGNLCNFVVRPTNPHKQPQRNQYIDCMRLVLSFLCVARAMLNLHCDTIVPVSACSLCITATVPLMNNSATAVSH